MVFRGRLGEPHGAGVAGELARLERPRDRVAIADLPPRGVHEVRAPLHLADQLVVEQVLRLGGQGGIDRDHVADRDERLGVRVERDSELLLDVGGEAVPVGVVQGRPRRLQSSQYRGADPAGRERS